jgi:hypothetical protein
MEIRQQAHPPGAPLGGTVRSLACFMNEPLLNEG